MDKSKWYKYRQYILEGVVFFDLAIHEYDGRHHTETKN